ncbi:MAG: hypothetical protein FWG54_03960 [Bacteroidetes bacterium]|nr:hypothetical protein [Bacteroidota bacterium]
MQTKLQELTDKLYQEGLSKGKQEAKELLDKAKREANALLRKANAQAETLIKETEQQIAEQQANAHTELKMAAQQSVAKLKSDLESLVLTKMLQPPIHKATSDVEFMKTMISTALATFNPQSAEAASLSLLLPSSMQEELDAFVQTQLKKQLKGGLTVVFDKKQKTGFTVVPLDEGYQLRFSDEDFEELFSAYLRPKTKSLLFG